MRENAASTVLAPQNTCAMPLNMKLIGLTGGIGMGKSAASSWLTQANIPVADTDVIARQVVEPGTSALQEVLVHFGAEFADSSGKLRRDALARRVFQNSAERKVLEDILHPRIREAWLAQAETWRQRSCATGVVVIPLLFETDAAHCFDATICIACSAATQFDRLRARGWTDEQISQRIQSQWPIERKMAAATLVVWTEGSLSLLARQLQRVLSALD
jgi:dephospho-CoA kinase